MRDVGPAGLAGVVGVAAAVTGAFGMNLINHFEEHPSMFYNVSGGELSVRMFLVILSEHCERFDFLLIIVPYQYCHYVVLVLFMGALGYAILRKLSNDHIL